MWLKHLKQLHSPVWRLLLYFTSIYAWPINLRKGRFILEDESDSVFCAPLDRYIVEPSADISTDTQTICRLTYLVRHSADISTEICRSTYLPIYRPRYRPSVSQHVVWLSADIAAETWPIRWPLTVGGISVDCRWYISRLSYNLSQKLRLPVMCISCFFVQP